MSIIYIYTFVWWILDVLAPGTGRRRAGARVARVPEASAAPGAPRLPAPRSPYGLETTLRGEQTAMVRPYVSLAERHHEPLHERAQQRRRRVAMVLAADFGIDLDRHVVGAVAVAG
ncbi:hypothetical protein ACWD5R_08330 [Streptomyces sp. NPDC002514]|uniref:hypothetical protein n=1 Tax=unclassified Streptomyces TaxID=2593676 RepID=UPI0036803377